MPKDDLHFRLRIPDRLKSLVASAAAQNHRSMTAEILARLDSSFGEDADGENISLIEISRKIDILLSLANARADSNKD